MLDFDELDAATEEAYAARGDAVTEEETQANLDREWQEYLARKESEKRRQRAERKAKLLQEEEDYLQEQKDLALLYAIQQDLVQGKKVILPGDDNTVGDKECPVEEAKGYQHAYEHTDTPRQVASEEDEQRKAWKGDEDLNLSQDLNAQHIRSSTEASEQEADPLSAWAFSVQKKNRAVMEHQQSQKMSKSKAKQQTSEVCDEIRVPYLHDVLDQIEEDAAADPDADVEVPVLDQVLAVIDRDERFDAQVVQHLLPNPSAAVQETALCPVWPGLPVPDKDADSNAPVWDIDFCPTSIDERMEHTLATDRIVTETSHKRVRLAARKAGQKNLRMAPKNVKIAALPTSSRATSTSTSSKGPWSIASRSEVGGGILNASSSSGSGGNSSTIEAARVLPSLPLVGRTRPKSVLE